MDYREISKERNILNIITDVLTILSIVLPNCHLVENIALGKVFCIDVLYFYEILEQEFIINCRNTIPLWK